MFSEDLKHLEFAACKRQGSFETNQEIVAYSIACSLKRIADALENNEVDNIRDTE